ncbi:MAG: tetratricopeptide repeat protein [Planctomycetes bacterium]|nr:tetratricopeptide repeat protein [Planctomycetota bacterium]
MSGLHEPGVSRTPRCLRAALLIVLVVMLSGANGLVNGFLGDDLWLLRASSERLSLLAVFSPSYWSDTHPSPSTAYRPVRTLSFALDQAAFGLHPFGYHLGNLILHAACSLLVFALVKRISQRQGVALFAALLFATHPVHVEAVAYVKNRAELLACLFYLAAFCLFLRRGVASQLGALAAFVLALLSKEMAATLPLVLTAYVLLRKSPSNSHSDSQSNALTAECECECDGEHPRPPFSPRLAHALPFWAMLALYLVLRFALVETEGVVPERRPVVTAAAHVAAVADTLAFYARVLTLPVHLCVHRLMPLPSSLLEPAVSLLGVALVVAVAMGVVRDRRFAFWMAWLFLAMLPAANILYHPWRPVAEQRMYIPSVGFCAALGLLAAGRGPGPRRAAALCGVVGLLALGTIGRGFAWKDEFTLQTDAVRKSPQNPKVHADLAKEYQALGHPRRAMRQQEWRLRAARPWELDAAHYELGRNYEELAELTRALGEYEAAIRAFPKFVEPHVAAGRVHARLGQETAAVDAWQRAIELDPRCAPAHVNLALVHLKRGELDAAQQCAQKALDADRALPDAHFALGLIAKSRGRPAEAAERFRQALKLDPSFKPALQELK